MIGYDFVLHNFGQFCTRVQDQGNSKIERHIGKVKCLWTQSVYNRVWIQGMEILK
jgi:hypothetical protein